MTDPRPRPRLRARPRLPPLEETRRIAISVVIGHDLRAEDVFDVEGGERPRGLTTSLADRRGGEPLQRRVEIVHCGCHVSVP